MLLFNKTSVNVDNTPYLLRQGSNERDSSSATARSSPVILSAAKDLAADRDRPFASLRVTGILSKYLECSPLIPMHNRLHLYARCRLEIRPQRIGHRSKRHLRHMLIRDTENLSRFLLKVKMKRSPARPQSACTSGKHETPHGWQD